MNALQIIVLSGLGAGLSWALIPLIQKVSTQRATNGQTRQFHQTHQAPISRLGGVALAVVFALIATLVLLLFPLEVGRAKACVVMVGGALAMFGVGFWDDLRPLGAKKKLILQIVIAWSVYFFGIRVEQFTNPLTGTVVSLGPWGLAATVLWLVALTNLVNLIDGIDGLAGGISLMLMVLLASVSLGSNQIFPAVIAVGMAGALVGFLRFNFPPARIYMGDGGAYLLGFLIAILSIDASHKGTVAVALIAPAYALGLPILDTAAAIIRRGLRGLPLFRADRKHIHHQLVKLGLSHRRAVLLLYGISLIFLLLAFGVFWLEKRLMPLWFGVASSAVLIAVNRRRLLPWVLSIGLFVRNSARVRKETRYALTLGYWFELEAERCSSVRELWLNYQFVLDKLGFAQVNLRLEDCTESWQALAFAQAEIEGFNYHSELVIAGSSMRLDFRADSSRLPDGLFEHLSEVAGEIWFKAALRWQAATRLPVRFDAAVRTETDSELCDIEGGERRLGNVRTSPTGLSVLAEAAIAGQTLSQPMRSSSVFGPASDFANVQLQL